MKFYSLLGIMILGFISCKKDIDESASIVEAELEILRLSETNFTNSSRSEKKYEFARASFYEGPRFIDGVAVTYASDTLLPIAFVSMYYTKQANDSLVAFTSKLDGGQLWTVSANPAENIPGFTIRSEPYSTLLQKHFDSIPVITRGMPFTISWDNTIPCDSLSVWIQQSAYSRLITAKPGNISSVTFPGQDLNLLIPNSEAKIYIDGISFRDTVVAGMTVKVLTFARRVTNAKVL
jgi:hypothetical protein